MFDLHRVVGARAERLTQRITTRLARRVRELRDARGLSLDALAARSGVSRSNISLIERGESSPTATVLDKLASGLGVALASLFDAPQAGGEARAAPSPVARVAEQPVWTDPASGYLRRNVSPTAPSPLQLVDVVFPPGQRVAYGRADHGSEIHQQIWMIDGRMDITVDGTTWQLEAGDCLAHRLEGPIEYHNPTRRPTRYLVALATLPNASSPPHRSQP
ncbi:XRE family transcriptional regulator [Acidovorax sp. SUPP3334]|nr:XRE family transcriptional regulator [Acidovorax sp. SUPP3334]